MTRFCRRLPPLPGINDILKMYGIRAKKNLSQNFIMDPSVLQRFVRSAGNLEGKHVIEVGPGPGGITRTVFEQGASHVHVIEIDPRFLPTLNWLKESVGEDRLHIHVGDCLTFNAEKLLPSDMAKDWDSHEQLDVVLMGNLPFNVGTPFLIRLVKAMDSRSNFYKYGRVPAILTLQHEVALRLASPPGDGERSRLSVTVQNYAEVSYLYSLPGGAFVPPPKVEVGVVKLIPHRQPFIDDLPFAFSDWVITNIFRGKKRNIRNTIATNFFAKSISKKRTDELLSMVCLDPSKRAVDLSMEEIRDICHGYRNQIETMEQDEKTPIMVNLSKIISMGASDLIGYVNR